MSGEVKKYACQRDFFWELSSPTFDKKVRIKDSGDDVKAWKIYKEAPTEYSNPIAKVFAYGLRMFAASESYESKVAFANNLNQLVVENEPGFKKWGCKVDVIAKNLAGLRDKVANSCSTTEAKKLKEIYNATIKAATKTVDAEVAKAKAKAAADKAAAEKARFEAAVKGFAENPPAGLKHEDKMSAEDFYNNFGRTAWFGLFGGFNSRIRIIENNGRFEIFTMPKLGLKQRLLGNRKELLVSFEEKLASVKVLGKKIRADEDLIKKIRPNVEAMVKYLQAQLPKICRNLTPTQAAQISKEVKATIADLISYGNAIVEARSKEWSCRRGLVWTGKNLVLRPTVYITKNLALRPTFWVGKQIVNGTVKAAGYGASAVGTGLGYGARGVATGIGYGAGAVGTGLGYGARGVATGIGYGAGAVGTGLGYGARAAVTGISYGASGVSAGYNWAKQRITALFPS